MNWCTTCGRPLSEHERKKVLTPTGMVRTRICPVERKAGSSASSLPPRFAPKREA